MYIDRAAFKLFYVPWITESDDLAILDCQRIPRWIAGPWTGPDYATDAPLQRKLITFCSRSWCPFLFHVENGIHCPKTQFPLN